LARLWQDISWLEQLDSWLRSIAMQYGYLGIFITSFIGTASIIVPIPYTALILILGEILDPLLLAFSAGAGAALGEFSGYIIGYYGRAVISDERKRKMEYVLRIFDRYGSIAIFIFALTPLPDDLLFVPLGIMRYNFFKAFIPCILGKITMSLILAYGGRLSIGIIKMIYGGEENNVGMMLISTILLIAIIVIMLKIDWEKLILPKEETLQKQKSKPDEH